MKNYQDMVTGQIYAFEDDYDPFLFDNRFIPKIRTKNIKTKSMEALVGYDDNSLEEVYFVNRVS